MADYQVEHKKKNIYDKEVLKQIPILDVARDLGLRVQYKGGNHWCSVRPEDNTPSTILHVDKNSYKDFGGEARGGDVIDFVGYVMGMNFEDSQEWLANQYGIAPKVFNNKGRDPNELNMWDYEKIGLYGDRASKNFVFDLERLPYETNLAISERYSMPMNELRRDHPKTYASILVQKAIPYVNNLRNNYLLSVWGANEIFKEIGCKPGFFEEQCRNHYFDDKITVLQTAEKILYKAAANTTLKVREPKPYDPIKDLANMMEGALKPQLGTLTYNEMQKRSQEAGVKITYRKMPLNDYELNHKLQDFPHTAFMSKGEVIIGFLANENDKFLAVLKAKNQSLDKRVADAKARTQNAINNNTQREMEI